MADDDVRSVSAKSKETAEGSLKKKGKDSVSEKKKSKGEEVVELAPERKTLTKDDQPGPLSPLQQKRPTEDKVSVGGEKRPSGEKADGGEKRPSGEKANGGEKRPSGEKAIEREKRSSGENAKDDKGSVKSKADDNKSEGEAITAGKKQRLGSTGPTLPPLPKQPPAPPPSSVEEEFLETTDEDGYAYLEDTFGEEEDEMEPFEVKKSRKSLLREKWENTSFQIRQTFKTPSRVFKLRGYHSEPDLSIPFEDKWDLKWTPVQYQTREDNVDGIEFRRIGEKFVSCEDITSQFCTKEHPDLVRGVLSEVGVNLGTFAIDDEMKNSWWELHEAERNRFSFFDELFAMGYVVDSLEILSPPPKAPEGVPETTGQYFVEADEKHYRKKVDYGRVVFKTKHVYTGNFEDWYFEGPGRYCWQDGTVYQGEFCKGLMHGPGSIHWSDGSIYEGHFIHGRRTGWGVYVSADSRNTFAGEWLDGLPHGDGKMWYDPEDDDNDYYEGQWYRGLPEGMGTRQYATGDRYVGNWMEGMRNGYGIMIWLQERQVYKGDWRDGVPHGTGKHVWYLERSVFNGFPTRHVYQGEWTMGRREGIGKMIYPCGSIYEGRWKNGQRHGKGMYINPAGDILVGLFRAGSILGGNEVPLYAPTYDCDYVGLTEWLAAKFKLPLTEIPDDEEEKLNEITKQYLPYIRKLYHRAGEYSQKYGGHGLYPAYLKKSDSDATNPSRNVSNPFEQHPVPSYPESTTEHHHFLPTEYNRLNEPEHMKGKVEKPESLDGVNPVTRFGLWLLLRDCDNMLDEVTMAYYDKIWCEMPPLSFQTRHNPFEPVYLWQFLQVLIATSVAFWLDVPKRREHAAEWEKRPEVEPLAVSDTMLQGGISQSEQIRADIVRQQRILTGKGKPKQQTKNEVPQAASTPKKEDPKPQKKQIEKGKAKKETPTKRNSGGEKARTSDTPKKKSKELKVKGKKQSKTRESSESRKSEDTEEETDILTSEGEEEYSSKEEEEEANDEDEDFDSLRSSMASEEMQDRRSIDMTISECFESFLLKKLLPCLQREAGSNLPVMPQPLPCLADMYDAFKGIKQRDIIRGKEFFQSALPHLLLPNAKDTLWWHRCPEPLSHSVDMDELLEMLKERFENVEEATELEENFEEKFESEYLGAQAQNSNMTLALLKLCRDNPTAVECPAPVQVEIGDHVPVLPVVDSKQALTDINVGGEKFTIEDVDALMDFTTDGQPFADNELVPEPFLWADDYKCIPVRRKHQHFENINTNDVFNVIQQLYPRLCSAEKYEKNLQFEFIFCDWLWCISLLAKTSTERECRDAWKTNKDDKRRPLTNPQSFGVYAHYVKLIKNNPYLSPNPPPDFQPKRKSKQFRSSREETKGAKFI